MTMFKKPHWQKQIYITPRDFLWVYGSFKVLILNVLVFGATKSLNRPSLCAAPDPSCAVPNHSRAMPGHWCAMPSQLHAMPNHTGVMPYDMNC